MTGQHSLMSLGTMLSSLVIPQSSILKAILSTPKPPLQATIQRTSKGLVRNQVRRRVLGLELRGVLAQRQGIRLGKVVAPAGGKERAAGA